ncbi:CPBP family intramembrane glutamic endopeptidase [Nonomuraea basaltis]|uniref:CPBP family intramembrane glutamic endopeptidase n=1 Tax=Nonomuraea basaltis TaxID=2495887 RepID=UPI00110C617B|nr:CPBP family intramembrane glutamic endopeptidase [Nonomuraea basaltis]TMR97437.1 CPBP family intramembrane metalloprotease [Nonomuraea basaltis]
MRKLLGHPLPQAFTLLVVVLAVFFVLQAVLAAAFQIGPGNLTPALGLLLGLAGVVAALITVPLARRMEGESLAGLGFPAKNVVRHLLGGFAVGAGVQAAVFGIMAVAGWYTVSAVTVDVGSLVTMTLLALCVAFWEEWAFRGVLLRLPEKAIGSWWALALSAAVFGLIHAPNANATAMTLVGITVAGGLVLGGGFLLTRSLWLPIGIHTGWNLFQSSVFGAGSTGAGAISETPLLRGHVSGPQLWTGGPGDPESGLVLILVAAAAGAVLLFMAVRAGRARPPRRKTAAAIV